MCATFVHLQMASAHTLWEYAQTFCAYIGDLTTKDEKLRWCQRKSAEITRKLHYYRSEQEQDPFCFILAIQVGELETKAHVLEMIMQRLEREESLDFPEPSDSSDSD